MSRLCQQLASSKGAQILRITQRFSERGWLKKKERISSQAILQTLLDEARKNPSEKLYGKIETNVGKLIFCIHGALLQHSVKDIE